MGSANRIQSVGTIVDFMSRSDRDELEIDVCINFEHALVKPVTLPSSVLISAGVEIALDRIIVAEINPDADEEFFVHPTSIEPLLKMEEIYRIWR